jgi:hypothetical protein
VRHRRLLDDELDRLLQDALADDLPPGLEGELRREARLAWRRSSAAPPRLRWRVWRGSPAAWRPVLPQPALVAAALAMLGLGTVMQAAPPPAAEVASFQAHEAAALTAQALERARAMECAIEVADEGGHRARYSVDWRATGETRVRLEAGAGPEERLLRVPGARPTVLTRSAAERDGSSLDPALAPVRPYLSPAKLGERLATGWRHTRDETTPPGTETFLVGPRTGPAGLTVVIESATHLPIRLDGAEGRGRTEGAVCRWR